MFLSTENDEEFPMPFTSNAIDNIFNTVNKIAIGVLSIGHIILFFMFFLMGIHYLELLREIYMKHKKGEPIDIIVKEHI